MTGRAFAVGLTVFAAVAFAYIFTIGRYGMASRESLTLIAGMAFVAGSISAYRGRLSKMEVAVVLGTTLAALDSWLHFSKEVVFPVAMTIIVIAFGDMLVTALRKRSAR